MTSTVELLLYGTKGWRKNQLSSFRMIEIKQAEVIGINSGGVFLSISIHLIIIHKKLACIPWRAINKAWIHARVIWKHCVKSVRIRSYSAPYFLVFGLNTQWYFISLRNQSECGKIRTRITPNVDTFYAVEEYSKFGTFFD